MTAIHSNAGQTIQCFSFFWFYSKFIICFSHLLLRQSQSSFQICLLSLFVFCFVFIFCRLSNTGNYFPFLLQQNQGLSIRYKLLRLDYFSIRRYESSNWFGLSAMKVSACTRNIATVDDHGRTQQLDYLARHIENIMQSDTSKQFTLI